LPQLLHVVPSGACVRGAKCDVKQEQ
jgi:hypothetical protein